jgi:hypothetical protein
MKKKILKRFGMACSTSLYIRFSKKGIVVEIVAIQRKIQANKIKFPLASYFRDQATPVRSLFQTSIYALALLPASINLYI